MSNNFETSKINGVHYQLSRLVGEWQGTAKVWFEPGNPVDESPISGTMRLVLGGRFIMHEYKGSFGDKPLSEGERGSKDFKMLGSYTYVTPETEQHWGWRTKIEIISDDEVVITAYNISPEGEEAKATETVYKKVK